MSSLLDDCLTRRRDLVFGGTRYNLPGVGVPVVRYSREMIPASYVSSLPPALSPAYRSEGVVFSLAVAPGAAVASTAWPHTPAWVAAYPGAQVDVADTVDDGGAISFRSADPPDLVIGFYRARARRAGLAIRGSAGAGPQRELDAGGETRSLMVNAAALNGGSVVSLVYRAS